MSRLYIVDQNGFAFGGHYQAYTACIIDGARQFGVKPIVLANKRARGGADAPAGTLPCFTYSWGEAERDGRLEWGTGNFAYELFTALRRLRASADDHVFIHTLGFRELLALVTCLATRFLPGDPLPFIHVLIRRDPDFLIDNYEHYSGYFEVLAASAYFRRKIIFHTDTDLLSQAFAALCGVPFATAPIPFDQSLLLSALAARPPRQPDDPLTIVYLGDAREEKGYQYLPQALSILWRDYIAKGRVRFILQSNFNTPGGERGILAASQNLAGFPSTSLKTEPLAPSEYYGILADADIVLIPYSARQYRYRSSGVLVEAMGAGKPVVTSAGSWMAAYVPPGQAILFDEPGGIGPAIAEAIDKFDVLSTAAQASRAAVLAQSTGESLVHHLLASAPPASSKPRERRRILLVMNGDAMVLSNGASRVMQTQLRYLALAGHDVVGLFLTYDRHQDTAAYATWQAALARSIAPFALERAFVAGPGDRGCELRPAAGAPLRADFDYAAAFEFPGDLLIFLRAHPIDAVWLNYITNYPVLDALGLGDVPVVCEMHDLQAFQRAIYGRRVVDAADLDEEFAWLSRCTALISLNEREAAIARERLPGTPIETTGVILPPPPSALTSLAGARNLTEIVRSTAPVRPEYQAEASAESGEPGESGEYSESRRLDAEDTLDLLFVSSAHQANVSGLGWFLREVYEPYLAPRHVSMIVAGSICRIADWPKHPHVFFIDQVQDLAPLYAATQVVVLPIAEGAGSPVKTYEALNYGRPVVGTSHAFRGLDDPAGEFTIHDDPRAFADAVLELICSAEARGQAIKRSRAAASRLNDFRRYLRVMDRVFDTLPGRQSASVAPPPAADTAEDDVEWSPLLRAVNRLVRASIEGDPLDGDDLDVLAQHPADDVDHLTNAVMRSLFEVRDAAVLKTEHRLRRGIANNPSWSRAAFAYVIQLALAERGRRVLPAAATRIVSFAGLALSLAWSERTKTSANPSVVIDGRRTAVRPVTESNRLGDTDVIMEAELKAVDARSVGFRTTELAATAITIARQTVAIAPNATVLERPVFGQGFVMRPDLAAAELPANSTGHLLLPRVIDGRNEGIADLLFATPQDAGASGVTITLNDQPAATEALQIGPLFLVRVFVPARNQRSDFGTASLSVTNRRDTPLRLIGVSSALLLGPHGDALRLANVMTLAGRRPDDLVHPQLIEHADSAIDAILKGGVLDSAGVAALCWIATGGQGREALKAHAARRLAPLATAGTTPGADAVVDDIEAVVDACLGLQGSGTAVMHPALACDIVDIAGNALPAGTGEAMRKHTGSWRLALPSAGTGQLKIQLDASLEIPGHPGIVTSDGFYGTEAPGEPFRWTGPAAISTITLPVAINHQARLVIELGSVGNNRAESDFTVTCNGRTVPHQMTTAGRSTTLTAEISPPGFATPVTQIGLGVREQFNPEPPDRRTLGVVFRSLSLLLFAAAPPAGAAAAPDPRLGR